MQCKMSFYWWFKITSKAKHICKCFILFKSQINNNISFHELSYVVVLLLSKIVEPSIFSSEEDLNVWGTKKIKPSSALEEVGNQPMDNSLTCSQRIEAVLGTLGIKELEKLMNKALRSYEGILVDDVEVDAAGDEIMV